MLKEKIQTLVDNDPLILHKIGLTLGTILGIAVGLYVSERADFFEVVVEEVMPDGETGN